MSDAGGGEAAQSAPSDAGSPSSSGKQKAAAPATKSPRKLINSARGLGKTAFGLTEHQLMLADLFKSTTPATPEGEPKNIEVLQQLAKPLARHKVGKFFEEEEKERELAKKNAVKAHDLPEPKNMEWILQNSKPLPRLKSRRFEDEIADLKAKPKKVKELPEPKNLERLLDLSKPLKSNKKFETILAEEEALLIKKTGQGTFDPTIKKTHVKPKAKTGPASPRKPAAAVPAGAAEGEAKAGTEATSPSAAANANAGASSEEKKDDGGAGAGEQKSAEASTPAAASATSPTAADGGKAPDAAAAGDAEEASELGPEEA